MEHDAVGQRGLRGHDVDEGGRHVELVRDDEVAEVAVGLLVVEGEPTDVEHGRLSGELEVDVLA